MSNSFDALKWNLLKLQQIPISENDAVCIFLSYILTWEGLCAPRIKMEIIFWMWTKYITYNKWNTQFISINILSKIKQLLKKHQTPLKAKIIDISNLELNVPDVLKLIRICLYKKKYLSYFKFKSTNLYKLYSQILENESQKLEKVTSELKKKVHNFLSWNNPFPHWLFLTSWAQSSQNSPENNWKEICIHMSNVSY
jgi:hypothetical protein